MKKLLVLSVFVFAAGMVSAQKCTKADKAKCLKKSEASVEATSTDSETRVASALSIADIAAKSDENIVRKVCDYSGTVSYYKKHTCDVSGKVSMDEVSYDEESSSFVNVSPKDVISDKDAKVVKASSETKVKSSKKACCAGKDGKACSKACCAGKSAKSCSKSKAGA